MRLSAFNPEPLLRRVPLVPTMVVVSSSPSFVWALNDMRTWASGYSMVVVAMAGGRSLGRGTIPRPRLGLQP